MTKKEIIYAKKQRDNISLLKIHKMLASDLLFFYTTYILFLTNVRNLQMSNIVLAGALYGIFKVICQVPSVMIIEKLGYKASIIIGDLLLIIAVTLIIFATNPIILYLAYLFMLKRVCCFIQFRILIKSLKFLQRHLESRLVGFL